MKWYIKISAIVVGLCIIPAWLVYGKSTLASFFNRVKSCSLVPVKAGQVAYYKAAYKTKMGFLKAADKLQVLDPRLTGLTVAEKGAQAGLQVATTALHAAQQSLKVAQAGAQGASFVLEQLSRVAGQGFNVKRAFFSAHMNKLKGPIVGLGIEAQIAGKDIFIPDIKFNFASPLQSATETIKEIIKKL